MPKVKKATTITTDENNLATIELVSIAPKEGEFYDQYEWVFALENSRGGKSIKYEWSGQTYSPEKTYEDELGNLHYNKFTELALNTGLINLEDLSKDEVNLDFKKIEGKKFKAKLQKSSKRRGLKDIVISSIEPIEE